MDYRRTSHIKCRVCDLTHVWRNKQLHLLSQTRVSVELTARREALVAKVAAMLHGDQITPSGDLEFPLYTESNECLSDDSLAVRAFNQLTATH